MGLFSMGKRKRSYQERQAQDLLKRQEQEFMAYKQRVKERDLAANYGGTSQQFQNDVLNKSAQVLANHQRAAYKQQVDRAMQQSKLLGVQGDLAKSLDDQFKTHFPPQADQGSFDHTAIAVCTSRDGVTVSVHTNIDYAADCHRHRVQGGVLNGKETRTDRRDTQKHGAIRIQEDINELVERVHNAEAMEREGEVVEV